MTDGPLIIAAPLLRCGHRARGPAPTWCGRPAVSLCHGSAWDLPVFHCARHAGPLDLPLPAERSFRRVMVQSVVAFAGISARKPHAEAEAIAQLERGVADLGGLLVNVSATSAIVRHRAYGADSGPNGDTDKG